MRFLTTVAAALAVLVLALTMFASSAAPAPAVTRLDRCMLCHPQAHPDGWTDQVHISELKSGEVSMSECTNCHTVQYCTDCHARYQSQAGSSQPATTP